MRPLLVSKSALNIAGACSVGAAGFLSFDLSAWAADRTEVPKTTPTTPTTQAIERSVISLLYHLLTVGPHPHRLSRFARAHRGNSQPLSAQSTVDRRRHPPPVAVRSRSPRKFATPI